MSVMATGSAWAGRMAARTFPRPGPTNRLGEELRLNTRVTHLGDVVYEDIVKLAFASEELDEVLSLGLGTAGASYAVPGLEESDGGMPAARISDFAVSLDEYPVGHGPAGWTVVTSHVRPKEARGAGHENVVALGDGRHGDSLLVTLGGVRSQVLWWRWIAVS